jgi:hypothetical protein
MGVRLRQSRGNGNNSGTQIAIENEEVIMTLIAAGGNAPRSTLRGFRRGRSSFLRSHFARLSICALQLAPPSGAKPIVGSGLAADFIPHPRFTEAARRVTAASNTATAGHAKCARRV